jgi:CubicO group peptidase (beta-lactamase class C family)
VLSLIVALAAVLQAAPVEPARPRDLAALLEPLRSEHGVPALAGAIVTTEGLVALGAVGLRAADAEVAVTPQDLWHLGSCTKAMTATLAARLVEQQLCTWETTPGEVFVDLQASMDPAWRDVPLRLLLAHRAGAPAGLDADGLWGRLWAHTGTPREQRRTLVEGVLARPPDPAPGTGYVYSNAGYALAGAMLETLTDTPWEQLLRREVFEPLDMQAVGFGAPGTAGELDQPLGHHAAAAGPRPQPLGPGDDNPAAIGPGGTVHASLEAWARFVAAHLRGARGQGDFLQAGSWRVLHTPLEGQEYALGWGVTKRPWAGATALTHSGSNTMWFCSAWLAPERGFAVLAATNVGGDDAARACDRACAALIGAWLERSEEPR